MTARNMKTMKIPKNTENRSQNTRQNVQNVKPIIVGGRLPWSLNEPDKISADQSQAMVFNIISSMVMRTVKVLLQGKIYKRKIMV